MKTVAVMQPYFFPYAGYFRLFAASDVFVLYDCVQFPRRGWVHRNRMVAQTGNLRWLTLPLEHAPREARIADLQFRPQAGMEIERQLRRFPALVRDDDDATSWCAIVRDASGTPVDYLEKTLRLVCAQLGLETTILRSSALGLPEHLHGEERILAIAEALSADVYVNSPGGRELYSTSAFERHGVELRFLEPWEGSEVSMLQRMVEEESAAIADEILTKTATVQ